MKAKIGMSDSGIIEVIVKFAKLDGKNK